MAEMIKHHNIKRQDTIECLYCSKDLGKEEWESQFIGSNNHYKRLECGGCGKENTIEVEFDGSGHDEGPDLDEGEDVNDRFSQIVEDEHKKVA